MIIAIHQPNYMPWIGYFSKIKSSNHFVFLDDAQYSKNNYINRVKVLSPSGFGKWITIPVSYQYTDLIREVVAVDGWTKSHLDILRNYYSKHNMFDIVWPDIEKMYLTASSYKLLSEINIFFIKSIMSLLSIHIDCSKSSDYKIKSMSDDRLIEIVKKNDSNGTYLSGKGGAKYQDVNKFKLNGIKVKYTQFIHPIYEQSPSSFIQGLSILDLVFSVGWNKARELI